MYKIDHTLGSEVIGPGLGELTKNSRSTHKSREPEVSLSLAQLGVYYPSFWGHPDDAGWDNQRRGFDPRAILARCINT